MKTTGTGAAALGFGPITCDAAANHWNPTQASEDGTGLSRRSVEAEIRRRADFYLSQDRLVVDYYRIRRKLAYPLPIRSLSIPSVPVPGIPEYPWPTWMVWGLEERIASLGWVAEWFGDEKARETVSKDLEALAAWPEYRQYGGPDLSSGHAGRMLWWAYHQWSWLDEKLRSAIETSCRRHVEMVLPGSEEMHGQFKTKEDLLALDAPYKHTHNIPFIGTVGAALTAHVAQHPAHTILSNRVATLFGAILDLRARGAVEGVSYDGYMLDFVSDWLQILDGDRRDEILNHPHFRDYLEESYLLGAPGRTEQVVEFSDVEPKEMPFHLSAQAKVQKMKPDPVRAWHLGRCHVKWIRVDGLAALRGYVDDLQGEKPEPGPANAHYAVVLRSGWEPEELAAAVSCTHSPMSHIQRDNGTVAIGSRGRWIIADPGYQQYMKDVERDFTLGPAAHNTPVFNGQAQDRKEGKLLSLQKQEDGSQLARIDLTQCYPKDLKLESVVRNVWLKGSDRVVVADRVQAPDLEKLTYHWHGHPDAAWWCEAEWVLLHFPDCDLWITSPQSQISDTCIDRLSGSRGQLTLVTEAKPDVPVVWWVFALGATPPQVGVSTDGNGLRVGEAEFTP